MGKTIGFPANAVRVNRASRAGIRRRIEKQFAPPFFHQPIPAAKRDYDVYMSSETLTAGVYRKNRDYRFVERHFPDGRVETIYSGPNLLDSRTVIQDKSGEIICTIRANHLGSGVIEVRYFEDGSTLTEHQALRDCDNFSFRKDSRGRITSLRLNDSTHLQFAYSGDNPIPILFTDKDGIEWRRCPHSQVYKNAKDELLGGVRVQLVGANESGSYMYSSFGRFTVTHRNGETEVRYFPTVRDLLDQEFPVTVAVRSDADIERAEELAADLRKQYESADIVVGVVSCEHIDGDIVDKRHISRFY